MMRKTFQVEASEEGMRLDRLVVQRVPELGRRGARELFAAGRVRVDGHIGRKGDRAKPGCQVAVDVATTAAEADDQAPLEVVREHDEWVILNKPAGQPSVAQRGRASGTAASALLARYPEMAAVGQPREAGLIHRLDTGTSGLMVAARTTKAYDVLRNAIADGKLEKRYLAVVAERDLPAQGMIDEALAPHPKSPRRVVVVSSGSAHARPATTDWRLLERSTTWALLEVTAHRAYRHQIRVHLAWLGFPIAGDTLYGGAPVIEGRHALHASYIAWAGADGIAGFEAALPVPRELARLLAGGASVN